MTDKARDDDNYELPPGIILPQDDSTPDYPNWKKGFLSGAIGGIFGAFSFSLMLFSEIISTKVGYAIPILGFVIFFFMVGSIAAFRPPKA